jgi:hypothetical protein
MASSNACCFALLRDSDAPAIYIPVTIIVFSAANADAIKEKTQISTYTNNLFMIFHLL